MAEGDGFLSRWSRRKAAVERGEKVAPELPPSPPPSALPPPAAPLAASPAPVAVAPATPTADAPPPPPTLDDVAALTKESDFSRFVARDTTPEVKNAAMKKLFASDPHFNTMDGLDVYIDDYGKFEPVPRNLLRQLVNARAMGLLDDELPEQPEPHNPLPPAEPAVNENADLQLQPDDAAGQPGVGEGVAERADPGVGPHDPVPPRGA